MGFRIITEVVTAAASSDLTDLDTVKTELGIASDNTDDDDFLSAAITQVSKAISGYCNRDSFLTQSLRDSCLIEGDVCPWQVPGGVIALQLSHFPVISVTSVIQSPYVGASNTLSAWDEDEGTGDYRIDAEKGQLLRLNPCTGNFMPWEACPTTVTYTAGYEAVPGDLAMACLRMVTQRYQQKGRDPLLMQEGGSDALTSRRWWVGTVPGQNGAFSPEIISLLDGVYRVPVVG